MSDYVRPSAQCVPAGSSRACEEDNDERTCWVCLGTESEDPSLAWVAPCKCRGTAKWVHQICIRRVFLDKKTCPQCSTPYRHQLPRTSAFHWLLKTYDALAQGAASRIAFGAFVLNGLWGSLASYGVVTLSHVTDAAIPDIIDHFGVSNIYLYFPLFPLALITARAATAHATFSFRHASSVPRQAAVLSGSTAEPAQPHIMPVHAAHMRVRQGLPAAATTDTAGPAYPHPQPTPPLSRIVVSALLLPYVCRWVGDTLFPYSFFKLDPVQRTFAGWVVYSLIREVCDYALFSMQDEQYAKLCILPYDAATPIPTITPADTDTPTNTAFMSGAPTAHATASVHGRSRHRHHASSDSDDTNDSDASFEL